MRTVCSVLVLMVLAYTKASASPFNNQAASKVEFALYYECMCNSCRDFISGQLYSTVKKVGSIVNVTLVPYGNTHEYYDVYTEEWSFNCQHGNDECVGDIIETCAIHILKDFEVYWPFIYCIETGNESSMKATAQKCAQQLKIDAKPILDCSTSKLGNSLEQKMAFKTYALRPRHKYVPWVTLNGVHTDAIQHQAETDLVKLICDTYTGPKPSGCN